MLSQFFLIEVIICAYREKYKYSTVVCVLTTEEEVMKPW